MTRSARVALAVLLVGLGAIPVESQEAEKPLSKLLIHGYLTQAYAISDGNQILGITDDGTTEYRTAALQFRYAITQKDKFFLQLSHEVLGASATNQFRDDVEMDWVYYQRLFGDKSSLRVGRVPLPIGIYNEIKDVGTILPFFRPSPGIYGDGTWTSDTVDGLVFSHKFSGTSDWSLEFDAYFGNWDRMEDDTSVPQVGLAEINNAFGVQLWLNTPVSGLRFGVGASRTTVKNSIYFPPGFEDDQSNLYLSIDASFDRVIFRSEYFDNQYTDGFWKAWYTELLFRVNEKLTLGANHEKGDLKFTVPFFAVFDDNWSEDFAMVMSYAYRLDLVLKLEHHWHEGYDIEAQPIDAFFGPQLEANFAILSLSVSF